MHNVCITNRKHAKLCKYHRNKNTLRPTLLTSVEFSSARLTSAVCSANANTEWNQNSNEGANGNVFSVFRKSHVAHETDDGI